MEITKDVLSKWFTYDNGQLFWKKSPNWSIKIGAKVGTMNGERLRTIFFGHRLYNHRIIYCLHHGHFPKVIDHIDGNPLNNNISNLREVTYSNNSANSKRKITNKCGYKGVYFHGVMGRYKAEIQVRGVQMSLGYFDTAKEAGACYDNAARKYFGEYSRTNN